MSYALSYRGTADTNKVLRNTFILLALTLIPTIFGSWVGFETGLPELMKESPWMSFFGFLAVALVLLFGIHATAATAAAIPLLGLFTFVIGANLTGILSAVLNLSNGTTIVSLAFLGTIGSLVGCSLYAMTTKRDFSSLGGFLFGSLIALIVFGLANMFFQLSWLALVLAFATLIVFTVYLIYDVQRVVQGGETNYILATTSIYLDLVNIFVSLLQIFGFLGGDD
jgi:modulator of FtsH protease